MASWLQRPSGPPKQWVCSHCGKVSDRMLIDFPEYCSVICAHLAAVAPRPRRGNGHSRGRESDEA
jgi:hypothetical protein